METRKERKFLDDAERALIESAEAAFDDRAYRAPSDEERFALNEKWQSIATAKADHSSRASQRH